MNENMPVKLNKQQELKLLEKLSKNCDIISNGSSRAVYRLNEGIVVKLAVDEGGKTQNANEVMAYQAHPELVARIYCYGEYSIVAEEIEISETLLEFSDKIAEYVIDREVGESLEDVYEAIMNEFEEYPEDFDDEPPFESFDDFLYSAGGEKELAYSVIELINDCTAVFGRTTDNYQMGFGQNGLVLYDYGFIFDEDCECELSSSGERQVGNMNDFLYEEGASGLIESLIKNLNE